MSLFWTLIVFMIFFLFCIHVFTNDFIYNIKYYLGLFGREPDFCSDSAIPNSLAVGLTL